MLLNPDFWNLYQCIHLLGLKDGDKNIPFCEFYVLEPRLSKYEKLIGKYIFNKFEYSGGGVVVV